MASTKLFPRQRPHISHVCFSAIAMHQTVDTCLHASGACITTSTQTIFISYGGTYINSPCQLLEDCLSQCISALDAKPPIPHSFKLVGSLGK